MTYGQKINILKKVTAVNDTIAATLLTAMLSVAPTALTNYRIIDSFHFRKQLLSQFAGNDSTNIGNYHNY